MSEKNEKLLKPLRDICGKISEANGDVIKHLAELKKYSEKAAFYEFHVFVELLEVISQNQELLKPQLKDIFKLLNYILNNESRSKEPIISRLYNFIIHHKDRLDLIDEFLLMWSFAKKEPVSTKPEHLFYVTEMLLRSCQTTAHRRSMYHNFQLHFAEHGSDEDLYLKLMQSINRSVSNFLSEMQTNETAEFLKETLLKAMSTKLVKAPSCEVYEQIFNLLASLAKYGHKNSKLLETGASIAEELGGQVTGELKKCNDILFRIFKICSSPTIDDKNLKELLVHYKVSSKSKPGCLMFEKTTQLLAKMLAIKISSIEETLDCFSTYHNVIIGIFHVLKNIKNQSGVISCCDDIKRHQIHNLSITILDLATKLAKTKKFNKSVAHDLQYHVTYDSSICNSLKCESKNREKFVLYGRIYSLLYEIANRKSMTPEVTSNVYEYVKVMLGLWESLPDEIKSTGIAPDNLAWNIYETTPTKESAVCSLNARLRILTSRMLTEDFTESSKDIKKISLKSMYSLREAATFLGFSSVTGFIRSKSFSCDNQRVPMDQIILIEICTIFRYSSTEHFELIAELFNDLRNETKNPRILAQACQSISDDILKMMNGDDFIKVNELLENERSKCFDVDISLALALNNYNIFFMKSEELSNSIRNDSELTIEIKHLKEELELLNYLNISLQHLTDLVSHLMSKEGDLDRILSTKRILNILNNMAVQYYIRGVKYKDLEALTLLWNLILMVDNRSIVLLNIGTFFLDHYQLLLDGSGNYVKISKKVKQLTIDDILAVSNRSLDETFMPSIESQSSANRCSTWSYMLSLCVYYTSQGRRHDGIKRWNQFLKSWQSLETNDESNNRDAVHSKIYFCMTQLNMNCLNRSADNFLSIASGILMKIKKISHDFVYHYHQIYYRITLDAINFSINRLSDMSQYDLVMMSLISNARKKGYFIKLLELLSLSILRNLNMEKIDNAKNQLKEITALLGIKDEILVKTTTKEASIANLDYECFEEKVRKVAIPQTSPPLCELSMVYQDQSEQLSSQLESFIHNPSCKCDLCSIPQFKFVAFQIGCHYSRLLWLINKFEVSRNFNHFALQHWRSDCDKLRRMKDTEFLMVNKTSFVVFSIRWLFQCADTLIKMERYEDIEEIYQEVDLICTSNIPDYLCYKEALYCRKENLNFFLENSSVGEKALEPELTFDAFQKVKKLKKSTSIDTSKRPIPKNDSGNLKRGEIIYVDLSDEETPPKCPKTTKKSNPRIQQTPKPAKSLTESSRKMLTRKAKVDEIDLTSDAPASTRKTRRRM